MKIRIYRTSGYPPNPIMKEKIKQEHRDGYDKILADLGAVNEKNKNEWPKRMEDLDRTLLSKYPRYEDRQISTIEDIQDLVTIFGTTLAFCLEKETETKIEKLVCYIMDNP